MIVEDQKNLKVHFAGLENEDFASVLHELGGAQYALFTVFPFIARKIGIKAMIQATTKPATVEYLQKNFRHVIMDSGLFTLMFGAHAGKRDEKFVEQWYEMLVDFVIQQNFKGTCVEVDCQKILGVKKAWEFRRRMQKDLPKNRIINTFHIEDGQKGLDEMIEFSEYIAISVPELRVLKKKDYCVRLANYVKNKKPEIDIHLLGCTEMKLLQDLNFCSSSDSTSWQQVNRYGVIKYNNGDKTISARNRDINFDKLMDRYKADLVPLLERWYEVTPKKLDYYSKYALAGELLKSQYARYAGNQD
jgi:hypothetical protein